VNVKLGTKLVGQAGDQPKIWVAVAHPGHPSEPPLTLTVSHVLT